MAATPQEALEILKAGNARFLADESEARHSLAEVEATAQGSAPWAVVLTCCDSRTPPELIFDQGLGSIFVIRIAGNVLDRDGLGTMEFACKVAGAKLIVVMGHTSCFAIKCACEGMKLGQFTRLLSKFDSIIEEVEGNGVSRGEEFERLVAEKNVENVVGSAVRHSTTLRRLAGEGKLGIVGAMYSVKTGEAKFSELHCGDAV